jgi:hypothetical protein
VLSQTPTVTVAGGKENTPNGSSGTGAAGEEEEEEEYVEQEGCPDEEDFNRWSHHASVLTCDDEALQRAMGDDNTVCTAISRSRCTKKKLMVR